MTSRDLGRSKVQDAGRQERPTTCRCATSHWHSLGLRWAGGTQMTSRDTKRLRSWLLKSPRPDISIIVHDKHMVIIDHLQETAHDLTDDVTWHRKVAARQERLIVRTRRKMCHMCSWFVCSRVLGLLLYTGRLFYKAPVVKFCCHSVIMRKNEPRCMFFPCLIVSISIRFSKKRWPLISVLWIVHKWRDAILEKITPFPPSSRFVTLLWTLLNDVINF